MLKPFITIKGADSDQLQDKIAQALTPIVKNPLLDGVLVEGCTCVNDGSSIRVEHKLGRKPKGWFVVGQDKDARIYGTCDEHFLTLSAVLGKQHETDWVSFTPTTSWSGSLSYDGRWRRVGDTMEVRVGLKITGSFSGTNLYLNLPSGYTIDADKFAKSDGNNAYSPLGECSILDSGADLYIGGMNYLSTTQVCPFWYYADAVSPYTLRTRYITPTSPVTFVSGDHFKFCFSVPIVGWTANSEPSTAAVTFSLWVF